MFGVHASISHARVAKMLQRRGRGSPELHMSMRCHTHVSASMPDRWYCGRLTMDSSVPVDSFSSPHRVSSSVATGSLTIRRKAVEQEMLLSRRNQLRTAGAGERGTRPPLPPQLPLQMHPVEFGQLALTALLKRPRRVLEWGSGGTTAALLKLLPDLEHLVAVEHNLDWHTHVLEHIDDPRLQLLLCRPGIEEPQPDASMPAKRRTAIIKRFTDQCEAQPALLGDYIDRPGALFPSYDLILVDGLARRACVRKGYDLLSPGGVLLLHDAQLPTYRSLLTSFPDHQLLDPWVQGQLCMVMRPLS
jgi:predicted O-methyltransferase YrrM